MTNLLTECLTCKEENKIMKFLYLFAFLISFVGALNWGFIGVFDFNLVNYIFATCCPQLEMAIYTIIGVSALLSLYERLSCSNEKN